MPAPLYRPQAPGIATTYADVENHAEAQGRPLVGTPGAVTLRLHGSGGNFYVRQYYDYDRVKRDEYIVAEGAEDAAKQVEEWRARIQEANDLIESVRLLSREGYLLITPKQVATLAPLVIHGVFAAGGVLVGSNAYTVIVNRLGIRSAAFATEDVDIARPGKLALPDAPKGGLLGMLRESGIDFVEIPPLDPRQPSTKFKERGRSRFTLDLLVPAPGDDYGVLPVPELDAHATALPYLRYLLGETQVGAALSKHGVLSVRVPTPERFAFHKMIVSQLRSGSNQKAVKDRQQAAVLIAAVGEMHPGALELAYERTPVSTRKHIRKSFEGIRHQLEAHPQSLETMKSLLTK